MKAIATAILPSLPIYIRNMRQSLEHQPAAAVKPIVRPTVLNAETDSNMQLSAVSPGFAMPYDLQSKLLRVLQEDYIRRVGGTSDIPIDVRIIATVNEPPEKLIAEGKLRKDLYYRLNVVSIAIPPLRDRKDDIPVLTDAFLEKHNKKYNKEVWMVSEPALARLCGYNYPGNVRELENIIVQSVAMAETEHVLTERLLQMPMQVEAIGRDLERWDRKGPLSDYMANLEEEIIRGVMIENAGNISKAAETLSIKRQTLQHKLKKYGIKE